MPNTIDGEILTTLLQAFMEVFTLGIGRLTPYSKWILLGLLTIELAVLGAWMAMGAVQNYAVALTEIAMKTSVYLLLITQWPLFTRTLVKFFVFLGLASSGGVISQTDFNDPSKLAVFGISAMVPVMNRLTRYTGYDIVTNLVDIIFTGFAAMGAMLAYILFGIIVFLVLLLFYLMSAATVVLIPWGMIRQTSFLAEKAFAYIWAVATVLLIESMIAGAAIPVLQHPRIAPGLNPTFGQCMTFGIAGWAILLLAIVSPFVALSLLHGTPNLTPQQVSSAARSIAQSVQRLAHMVRTFSPTPNAPAGGAGTTPTRRPL